MKKEKDSTPDKERWLYENPESLKSVKEGIKQAGSGDLHSIGSFSKDFEEQEFQEITFKFPADEYVFLKMACEKQGISIEEFLTNSATKSIQEYEDELDIIKLRNAKDEDEPGIPLEEVQKELGWDKISPTQTIHKVTQAEYLQDYEILLTFEDETKKIVDFNEVLDNFSGSIFQPLSDIKYFKTFKIGISTIEWDNGADVSPDYLYEMG